MIVTAFATNNFIATYVPSFKTVNLKIYNTIKTGKMFLEVLTKEKYASHSRINNNLNNS